MKPTFAWMAGLALALAGTAHAQTNTEFFTAADPNTLINRNVKCDVPFPKEAMQGLPAGFKGEVVVLYTFTVEGRFRFARVMQSSGNETLDHAALRAGLEARCEPFGDPTNPALEGSLIGMPFQFTFDNSRGSDPVEVLPVR